MVRKRQSPANAMRMYRHFAVVTVALTGALAVFADGETRSALAEEIAEREQKNALARASAEKFGKPKLARRSSSATAGSFGPDSGEFGSPMDDAGGGNPSGYVPDYEPAAMSGHAPAAYGYFGMSQADWEALSDEEREALLRQVRGEAQASGSQERRQQIERLKASSAARGRALEV